MADIGELVPSGILPAAIADDRYQALDRVWSRISLLPVEVAFINMVDQADDALLYLLAKQFHIVGSEGWMMAETTEQKRNLIKSSIQLHKRRGTKWAVRYVLDLLGMSGNIVEWFETNPPGTPYHFTIDVDLELRALSQSFVSQLYALIDTHKPVRSWANYAFKRSSGCDVFVGAAGYRVIKAHLMPG